MRSSRSTLATIEAAAIETDALSPRTSVATSMPSRRSRSCGPSTRTSGSCGAAGPARTAASARRAASRRPAASPRASISTLSAAPIPTRAVRWMVRARASRRAGDSRFESRAPAGRSAGSRTTAATVTGPAHAPRPTSSIPTTGRPARHAARSRGLTGASPGCVPAPIVTSAIVCAGALQRRHDGNGRPQRDDEGLPSRPRPWLRSGCRDERRHARRHAEDR